MFAYTTPKPYLFTVMDSQIRSVTRQRGTGKPGKGKGDMLWRVGRGWGKGMGEGEWGKRMGEEDGQDGHKLKQLYCSINLSNKISSSTVYVNDHFLASDTIT